MPSKINGGQLWSRNYWDESLREFWDYIAFSGAVGTDGERVVGCVWRYHHSKKISDPKLYVYINNKYLLVIFNKKLLHNSIFMSYVILLEKSSPLMRLQCPFVQSARELSPHYCKPSIGTETIFPLWPLSRGNYSIESNVLLLANWGHLRFCLQFWFRIVCSYTNHKQFNTSIIAHVVSQLLIFPCKWHLSHIFSLWHGRKFFPGNKILQRRRAAFLVLSGGQQFSSRNTSDKSLWYKKNFWKNVRRTTMTESAIKMFEK